MLAKMFWILFFFLFLLFLLIISDRVASSCLCRKDLWICVLRFTQNNINHLKLLMTNYIIIWIIFLELLCWFKHAFIWKLQRTEFSSKVCKFCFYKLRRTVQVTLNHRLLIIWSFESFLNGFFVDQNMLLCEDCRELNL